MAVLLRFATPAHLSELEPADRDAWSSRVRRMFAPHVATFPQFYDPTESDTPTDALNPAITWTAFPATLLRGATSQEQRWQAADASRARQDEYCEWSVERDQNGRVTRVTFTSEVPEYFEHLAERDPDRLLAAYEELTAQPVTLSDLIADGRYRRDNAFNNSSQGRLVHLVQQTNNLGAAITLAAQATILRQDAARRPITTAQELVICGRLGEPLRNSDPQIAAAVNDAAATGADITLEDPVGLYITGILTAGMETPDGADPVTFWTIERGTPDHILRASYAVPPEQGYTVGDITLDGRPIQFGAQLADRVGVRLTALVKPGTHQSQRHPCE